MTHIDTDQTDEAGIRTLATSAILPIDPDALTVVNGHAFYELSASDEECMQALKEAAYLRHEARNATIH